MTEKPPKIVRGCRTCG